MPESTRRSALLQTLLTQAAVAPIENTGWLRVTGSDRVRWLNGMVTNSIQSLTPGEGCYNFLLNAQGRIQGDCTAFLQPDSILLETSADLVPALVAYLDRFIIMDDVELTPVDHLSGILIAGPQALAIVQALGGSGGQGGTACSIPARESPQPESLNLKQTAYAEAPVMLIRAHSPLVPRFEIWSDPATVAAILEELRGSGTLFAGAAELTQLRLLEGTPAFGTDIRDRDLPQETNQTRALHFSKGCYLGQEIVERIRSRGAVHRTLHLFTLTGDLPAPGTPLLLAESPEKLVGELTSAARIPLPSGEITLALGSIRREALSRPLSYAGGTAEAAPSPYPLP